MNDRATEVARLRAARPRSAFLRWSGVAALAVTAWAWWAGAFSTNQLFTAESLRNVDRFLNDIRPYPLQGRPWDWGVAWEWARGMYVDGHRGAMFEMPSGADTVALTFAISVVAIVLAGIGGVLAAFPAASTFSTPGAFLPGADRPRRFVPAAWRALLIGTRALLIGMRSIPEYVWAFLLIGMLGISAWPAVLALTIHNTGILGKLDAETVENLSPGALASLRASGATRSQIAAVGAVPAALSRFLLYFFYRWETCVREATVLGMLGIASLGFALNEARVRDRYDDMIFYVLLGAALVMIGDLVSAVARRIVRRAT